MKRFRAMHSFGCSFGMDIDARSAGYKQMKANIKRQTITGHWGIEVSVLTVPNQYVAEMMGEPGWLVAEKQEFRCFRLDDGEEIFIIYPDGIHI